ncbi:MAG: beta-ketoacyl synthase N-terminal-like domain-containing protein [Candidatus Limnocylindrus sp.]
MSRAEAAAMDPCQRLLLECGYAALHKCALDRSTLMGSLTGVFVGFSGSEYAQLVAASPSAGSVYAATGSSVSVACGRISYVLGLNGPCSSYDSACSSSLVASHGCLRALQLDEAVTGLTAAVNLMLAPTLSACFSVAGMTSARGRCHTFDDRADGYARSEACGSAVMRGGETTRALVVVGSAVRQDGRSASLTAPNGQAQRELLRSALGDAGLVFNEVGSVEAHGTGTALGDPIEVGAVMGVLMILSREAELVVGGSKANVGHAEPAAGMSGVVQLTTITLDCREVGANAQLRRLNPHVRGSLGRGACSLPVHWSGLGSMVVCGGVSSFGYSGTIAHASISRASSQLACPASGAILVLTRSTLKWRHQPHPFAQFRLVSAFDDSIVFRSLCAGSLAELVSDHVVQGRLIFPAAGYLEMGRSSLCESRGDNTAMSDVMFTRPLAIEPPIDAIECTILNGQIEVRSSTPDSGRSLIEGGAVHCSGRSVGEALAASAALREGVVRGRVRGSYPASRSALYDWFATVGLQYGPTYQTLMRAWGSGGRGGAGRLRARWSLGCVAVQPADLDDVLCLGALSSVSGGEDSDTPLPFAVGTAWLDAAMGLLWAVRLVLCIFLDERAVIRHELCDAKSAFACR